MYDGSNWTDDSTIPGWYICNGQTVDGKQVPNLIDKFVRGATSPGNGNGATSGANSHNLALEARHLPSHNHTFSNGATGGASKDLTAYWCLDDGMYSGGRAGGGMLSIPSAAGYDATSNNSSGNGARIYIDANHTHGVSGTIGYTGSNNTYPIPTIPEYYALIFIRKCFNR